MSDADRSDKRGIVMRDEYNHSADLAYNNVGPHHN